MILSVLLSRCRSCWTQTPNSRHARWDFVWQAPLPYLRRLTMWEHNTWQKSCVFDSSEVFGRSPQTAHTHKQHGRKTLIWRVSGDRCISCCCFCLLSFRLPGLVYCGPAFILFVLPTPSDVEHSPSCLTFTLFFLHFIFCFHPPEAVHASVCLNSWICPSVDALHNMRQLLTLNITRCGFSLHLCWMWTDRCVCGGLSARGNAGGWTKSCPTVSEQTAGLTDAVC